MRQPRYGTTVIVISQSRDPHLQNSHGRRFPICCRFVRTLTSTAVLTATASGCGNVIAGRKSHEYRQIPFRSSSTPNMRPIADEYAEKQRAGGGPKYRFERGGEPRSAPNTTPAYRAHDESLCMHLECKMSDDTRETPNKRQFSTGASPQRRVLSARPFRLHCMTTGDCSRLLARLRNQMRESQLHHTSCGRLWSAACA